MDVLYSGRAGRTWRPAAAVLLLLATLLIPPALSAQSTPSTQRGSISGVVLSDTGEPVSYADIHIVRLGLNARTDGDGAFVFTSVPAGVYLLRIERAGFGALTLEVRVEPGREARVDASLTRTLYQLDELIVSATAGARDPLTVPQSVGVVSTQDLSEGRGASMGALLSRQVPGVANLSTGPVAGIPVIRGLSGTRVRLMQNGVGQEFYQYGVRHQAPTSLSEAERVEVVRGVSSLLYGSDALGGAINVLTRDLPVSAPGETHIGGQVETEYASVNGEAAGLLDLHVATGGFGLRAGVERRDAGNLTTPTARTFFDPQPATGIFGDPKYAGELPFTNYDQWSGYLQGGVRGEFGRVEFFGNLWQSRQNYLLPPGGPIGSTTNPPLGVGIELGNLNLSAKGSLLAGSVVVRPIVAFQRTTRQAAPDGTPIEDATTFPVDLEKDVLTARVEVGHRGGNGTLGAEYQFVDGRRNGPVELEPASRVNNLALFALQEFPVDRSILSLGARLDYRRQEADPNELTTSEGLLEQDYTVLSASVGVSHPITDALTLAVNAGSGFRAPTIFEMFANGVHGGVAAFQRGNPELDPERSLNTDVALRLRSDRLRGEVGAFAQRIQDYIFLANTGASTPGGLPILEADQTDADLVGAEGLLEVTVLPWLKAGGSFAVIRGTSDELAALPIGNDDGDLPLIPENRFGGFIELEGALLGPTEVASLRLSVDHFRDRDAAGLIEPFSQFDDIPFGTASTQAYTLVSLQGRFVVEAGTIPLTIVLGADNLFDEAYRGFLDTYKGYALSPGRNIRVRLSAPFSW
jgi:iron complex outermembrane receptor protein/hemoglobin/transferrin/lactoferrin receptor protein